MKRGLVLSSWLFLILCELLIFSTGCEYKDFSHPVENPISIPVGIFPENDTIFTNPFEGDFLVFFPDTTESLLLNLQFSENQSFDRLILSTLKLHTPSPIESVKVESYSIYFLPHEVYWRVRATTPEMFENFEWSGWSGTYRFHIKWGLINEFDVDYRDAIFTLNKFLVILTRSNELELFRIESPNNLTLIDQIILNLHYPLFNVQHDTLILFGYTDEKLHLYRMKDNELEPISKINYPIHFVYDAFIKWDNVFMETRRSLYLWRIYTLYHENGDSICSVLDSTDIDFQAKLYAWRNYLIAFKNSGSRILILEIGENGSLSIVNDYHFYEAKRIKFKGDTLWMLKYDSYEDLKLVRYDLNLLPSIHPVDSTVFHVEENIPTNFTFVHECRLALFNGRNIYICQMDSTNPVFSITNYSNNNRDIILSDKYLYLLTRRKVHVFEEY